MSRNRTMARAVIAFILIAATLIASACSSSKSANPTGGAASPVAATAAGKLDLSNVTLHVGQTGWNVQGAALKVAGLDNTPYKVVFSVFTGGDKQLQALQAGALDVASASEIPPVFAAANVTPKWKAIVTEKANTLLQEVDVAKGSPITSIAELKGKKVGYVQNTTAQYFLLELLKQAGLTWSDITPAPLLPADGVAALNSGSIAAFANYGNSVITIKQAGGTEIGSGADVLSGNFVYLASNSALADPATKAAIADLVARTNKAYAIIRASKEQEFAQATATATNEPVAQALSTLQAGEQQHPTTFLAASQSAIDSEQKVADAFTSLGAVPKVDVASFWSDALNADLATALAQYPVNSP